MNFVRIKAIISGDVIEFYEYQKPYYKDYEVKNGSRGRKKGSVSSESDNNRAKVLQRAKKNLRRIINSNAYQYKGVTTKFLTLTFKENVKDIPAANKEFKKFVKRVNYNVFGTKKARLKYSGVIEFQKRGAIHYHVVMYNLPYVKADVLRELWGHGHIKINKISKVDNLGAYVTKYMTKDNDDDRLKGKKCYFNARGLLEPKEVTDIKKVESLRDSLPAKNLKYVDSFKSDYLGNINYLQFNLKYINKSMLHIESMRGSNIAYGEVAYSFDD